MDMPPADRWAMLKEAQAKAHRLVESLLAQQRQIEANPARLAAAVPLDGRKAFDQAVASARRAAAAIDEAVALAAVRHN